MTRRFGRALAALGLGLLLSSCAQLDGVEVLQPVACAQEPDKHLGVEPWFSATWLSGRGPSLINWMGCDRSAAQLAGSYLGSAQLANATLSDADLGNSYLSAANLIGARLQGANLQGAVMQEVFLRNADLSNANLQGAVLSGTFLGADFSGATWTDGRRCAEGSVGACR